MTLANPRLRTWLHGPARRFLAFFDVGQRHVFRFILHILRRYWVLTLLALVFNLLAALFEGATLAILTVAVDAVAGGTQDIASSLGALGAFADRLQQNLSQGAFFLTLVVLAVGSQMLYGAMLFAGRVAAAYIVAYVDVLLRSRLFRQFTNMSYAQVSRYKIGDLISYVHQVDQASDLFMHANVLISTLVRTMVYFGMLFWLSWTMTLAALVILGFLALSLRHIIQQVRRMAQAFIKASVMASERITEYIQGLRLIHVFGRREYVVQRVDQVLQESVTAKRKGLIWSSLIGPLAELIMVMAIAGFLILSYLLINAFGYQSISRAAVFVFVLYRLMPNISSINTSLARCITDLSAIERIAGVLRTDDKAYIRSGTRTFRGLRKEVAFQDVSLEYAQGERAAINSLSFILPAGGMIALVGESGAGKSTIVNLLLRLYDPSSGRIVVDGMDLQELNLQSWRDHIGVVDQDPFILNASVRDNIAFGKLDATDDEILAAAHVANAHEFIAQLKDGYETVVGDRGLRLSGGQRQRISIARAVLRNPDILVLDEATSDLDSQSERLIQESLGQLRQDRTLLVIAHRLSTIAMADQILVLEQGQVVEQGRHLELLALQGRYARFWQIQSKMT
jgi:ATP-binding cassette subfamily B protein/subfamily B ATP-binding cassette protein MsbA